VGFPPGGSAGKALGGGGFGALLGFADGGTRTQKQNFVNSSGVASLCAMALFFSLLAGIRLLFGIAWFLFSANTPQLSG